MQLPEDKLILQALKVESNEARQEDVSEVFKEKSAVALPLDILHKDPHEVFHSQNNYHLMIDTLIAYPFH